MRKIRKIIRLYKGIILSGLIAIFCFTSAIYIFSPVIKKIVKYYAQVQSLTREVKELRFQVATTQSLDEETLKTTLSVLGSALPQDKSPQTLMATIEKLSSQNGLTLSELSIAGTGDISTGSADFKSTDQKGGSYTLPATVTIEGTFDSLKQLLAQAITVRRLIIVRNFQVIRTNDTNVKVQLGLEGFYAPVLTMKDVKIVPLTPEEEGVIVQVSAFPWASQNVANIGYREPLSVKPNPFE